MFCERCGFNLSTRDTSSSEEALRNQASAETRPKSNPLGSLLGLIFSIGILYFLWTNFGSVFTGSPAASQPSTHRVKYMVDGNSFTKETGLVHVTMTNSSGGTEQRTVRTPWETEFSAQSGLIVTLSASNTYNNGYASAKIYIDGALIQQAHSPSGIASASGIVP